MTLGGWMDEQQTTLDGFTAPAAPDKKVRKPKAASAPRPSAADEAQIISYRHLDRRKNNPEVGVVNASTDPDTPKTVWTYDPHLDPALQFDSGRSSIETLIDDALATGDEAAMRAALEELKRLQSPYLNWTGKAERTSFSVDTVSLHVHERMDPMSILAAVRKQFLVSSSQFSVTTKNQKLKTAVQPGLFEAPFESLPLRDAIDFYKHDRGWANRLVAGDSLLVMNSLLQKEGMAGQVQMIYLDPPYGIKYGSNFQPFVGKRDVKDRSDADLTQEPEMIKAFRDTWELGIHSYLTYLRDRLLLAKDLLSESGSVFVQISDENVHLVRNLMDELFGPENFVSEIIVGKTSSETSSSIGIVNDFIVWYGKDRNKTKIHGLFIDKPNPVGTNSSKYDQVELKSGLRRPLTVDEKKGDKSLENGALIYRLSGIDSMSGTDSSRVSFSFQGRTFVPSGARGWSTSEKGLERLLKAQKLQASTSILNYTRYFNDYRVQQVSNLWTDIGGAVQSRTDSKIYVVQTGAAPLERCILMTTDPGDLVLDPTCGSGTTAFVAEKWGRRWITCDTSRVAVTLAKQRLVTASYDYFALKYPHEGLKGGFIYKTVPHVTLKSIANNPDIDEIYERMHGAIVSALERLNDCLVESFEFSVSSENQLQKAHFLEWNVPFDFEDLLNTLLNDSSLKTNNSKLKTAFEAFHKSRQAMQKQMDASIAAHADQETLFDQPQPDKKKLRITGPFTVEAVPFPTVLSLEFSVFSENTQNLKLETNNSFADSSIARTGESARQHQWRDELLTTGIRGKGGQMLRFAELETLAGTRHIHLIGTLDEVPVSSSEFLVSSENQPLKTENLKLKTQNYRVAVSFGPAHAALEQRQVELALREAGELFPLPKMIVFCAFAFDPEAAKDIDNLKGITALKAQMNTDLLTEDLKKARSSNQSFWLMGQPDVAVLSCQFLVFSDGRRLCDYDWFKELSGFDGLAKSNGLGRDDIFLYSLLSQGRGVWNYLTDAQGWNLHTGEYSRGSGKKQPGGIPTVSWYSQRLLGRAGNLDHALREVGIPGLGEFQKVVELLRRNPETPGRLAKIAQELTFPFSQLKTENLQLKTLHDVEVNGFDYFDTTKGELVSGGKAKIAMWLLDTDYDERSLFPRQVFFPLAGKGEGWQKLKKNIRAELNEDLLEQFHGTVSLPFEAGDNRKIAVKIVDDRGIESLKIIPLED
jgi:adenine-specific DNA-methyltransferase